MPRTFDELIAEADSVSVAGWDFSWLWTAGPPKSGRHGDTNDCCALGWRRWHLRWTSTPAVARR